MQKFVPIFCPPGHPLSRQVSSVRVYERVPCEAFDFFVVCRCWLLPLFSVPNQAIVGREVNQSSSKCTAPHRTGTRRADENGNELQRAPARSNGSVAAKRPSKNRGRRTDLAKWVFVKNLSSQASTPANLSVADRVGWAHAQAPNHVKRAAEQRV